MNVSVSVGSLLGIRFGMLHPDEPFSILGLEPARPASLRYVK